MDTPVSLGPFLGINNRLEDDSLAVSDSGGKTGDYLKDAVNVELNNSGMQGEIGAGIDQPLDLAFFRIPTYLGA